MTDGLKVYNNLKEGSLAEQPIDLIITPHSRKYFFQYVNGVLYALAFLNRNVTYDQVKFSLQNIDALIIGAIDNFRARRMSRIMAI